MPAAVGSRRCSLPNCNQPANQPTNLPANIKQTNRQTSQRTSQLPCCPYYHLSRHPLSISPSPFKCARHPLVCPYCRPLISPLLPPWLPPSPPSAVFGRYIYPCHRPLRSPEPVAPATLQTTHLPEPPPSLSPANLSSYHHGCPLTNPQKAPFSGPWLQLVDAEFAAHGTAFSTISPMPCLLLQLP